MRKLLLSFTLLALVVVACQNNSEEINPNQEIANIDMSDFYFYTDDDVFAKPSSEEKHTKCYSMQLLNQKLKENPGLYQKMYDIEKHTRKLINAKKPTGTPGGGNNGGGGGTDPVDPPTYTGNTIPVIFHVIYRTESENISDAQINSQIAALNEDFNLKNPGRNSIPGEFQSVESNIGVNFVLDRVVRVLNNKKRSWRPDDSMKFSSQGGSDAISPEYYLNIWVVNNMPYNGGNILGYAQFPGGDWATDGIVLDYRFTGNTSYSTGRTATHEIGHWMNLRHIWGDGGCSQDDFVADTPDSDRYNSGCPTYPIVHCGSNDMTMNFMDYSNDPCLNMFTIGQKDRMAPIFASGGFREPMGITIQ